MKKVNSWLALLLFGTIAFSCGKKNYVQDDGICTAGPASDTVTLSYSSPLTIFTGCRANLQATITAIADSRCPKDVVCVWAGKVSVVLQLANDFTVTLEKEKVLDTVWQDNHYSLQLVDVLPYPVSQPQTEAKDQIATVSIIRRKK